MRLKRNLDSQPDLYPSTRRQRATSGLRGRDSHFQPNRVESQVESCSVRLKSPQPAVEKQRPQVETGGNDSARLGIGADERRVLVRRKDSAALEVAHAELACGARSAGSHDRPRTYDETKITVDSAVGRFRRIAAPGAAAQQNH